MSRRDKKSLPNGRRQTVEAERRSTLGRMAYYSGIAAEEQVAAAYGSRGATITAQRRRTPYGELDLVVWDNDVLVFVEVKRRKRRANFDAPITFRQWQRLENAANYYMFELFNETGIQPICRFDVAIVTGNEQINLIENARPFDTL